MDEEQRHLDEIKGAYDAGDIDKVARLLYYETTIRLMNRVDPLSRTKLSSFVASFLEHVKQSGGERGKDDVKMSFEPEPRT